MTDQKELVFQNVQKIGDEKISVGGGSGLGSSEHVIERLNHYICNAGLVMLMEIQNQDGMNLKIKPN